VSSVQKPNGISVQSNKSKKEDEATWTLIETLLKSIGEPECPRMDQKLWTKRKRNGNRHRTVQDGDAPHDCLLSRREAGRRTA
jgi:hypothetical protein